VTIRVLNPGMLTTLQDLGRFGYAHLGVSPCGTADSLAFRIANLTIGNDANAPALEMTLLGATLEFESAATICIGGATVADSSIPSYEAVEVEAGFMLRGGPLTNGARSYLAIRGGFKVPRMLGSASTHLAGKFGGLHGRALKPGDVLECDTLPCGRARKPSAQVLDLLRRSGPIRVTQGPQWDWFDEDMTRRFTSSEFEISEQTDRSGLRLSGPEIHDARGVELLTEGVPLGAIQVPRNAQPIILFVDQQTTGGYPKIANVATVDLHRVGQLRPRDRIRFELISIASAIALLREQERILEEAFAE